MPKPNIETQQPYLFNGGNAGMNDAGDIIPSSGEPRPVPQRLADSLLRQGHPEFKSDDDTVVIPSPSEKSDTEPKLFNHRPEIDPSHYIDDATRRLGLTAIQDIRSNTGSDSQQ